MIALPHSADGIHLLVDFFGVAPANLRRVPEMEELFLRGARAAGARVLMHHFHEFDAAGGVTGVVLLAESHISIHTWPEREFAAIDIFMCGNLRPRAALEIIQNGWMPQKVVAREVRRGHV